jgi:hypothetical protein
VFGIGKTGEICPNLCHQHVEYLSAYPIDVFAALHLLLKWTEMPLNFCLQAADRAILDFDQLKQFSQQKAMMCSHFSSQSRNHLLFRGRARLDA